MSRARTVARRASWRSALLRNSAARAGPPVTESAIRQRPRGAPHARSTAATACSSERVRNGTTLAARDDGGKHRVRRGSQQDQRHARRRLLKRLEQRVRGVRAQLLGAVDDIHLCFGADGGERDVLEQLAGLRDEVARRGLGVKRWTSGWVRRATRTQWSQVPQPPSSQISACASAQAASGSRARGAKEQVRMARAALIERAGQEAPDTRLHVELGEQAVGGEALGHD